MSRRTTALLAVLVVFASFAPAAHAVSFGAFVGAPDFVTRAWNFLERIWAPGAASPDPVESRSGARAIWANNGACIDPNGRTAGASCADRVIWSDGGGCIDPDGKSGSFACANRLAPSR